MKRHLAAAALALLLPAVAHAQAAPAPKAEPACCCEKMDCKMDCCDMHGKDRGQESRQGADAHKGHHGSH